MAIICMDKQMLKFVFILTYVSMNEVNLLYHHGYPSFPYINIREFGVYILLMSGQVYAHLIDLQRYWPQIPFRFQKFTIPYLP